MPDPYRALGLARGATEADIKAAHRRLAKRYHPDAPGGDTDRFLMVQEAYKLLVDPLRRREWDARHSPGPVRASEGRRHQPRAADGRWTRSGGATGGSDAGPRADPMSSPGRDPGSRTYTWSASEDPWWEEGASRAAKRPPGRRRPREHPADPSHAEAAPDFDVYNRSSGAAWSSAARAYFRRGDSELPRRGSFHHEGSQPLTAARARVAQEEEARRARAAGSASAPASGSARASASSPPASSAAPAASAGRPSWVHARPASAAAGGVVRDADSIHEARSAARQRELAARWPTLGQRLLYALLAWAPIALVVGYGGAAVTGCDRASVSCPPELASIQTVAIAVALGLLVALPRLAYALALATAGMLVGALAVVVAIWFLGLRPPLSPTVLAVSSALLLVVHLAVASWVLSRARRPWAARRVTSGNARRGGPR